jgi:transcriptional regulator with XRE-family HTH domain
MKQPLGDYIRQRREQLGLTQRAVALHLGFKSIAHLSDIEGGNRNPGPEVLPRLAEILQTTVDELKDRDARAPIQEAKDLFEQRPEMVAAFRRVVEKARGMSAEDLVKRLERPAQE